jgi:hypothetical protein
MIEALVQGALFFAPLAIGLIIVDMIRSRKKNPRNR